MLQLLHVPDVACHAATVPVADALLRHCTGDLYVYVSSAGYTNGQDSASGRRPANNISAGDGPAHWQGSSWQPLQIHSDHRKTACLLPEYSLHPQVSGETQRQQPLAN